MNSLDLSMSGGEDLLKKLHVKVIDFMQSDPLVLSEKATVLAAAQAMASKGSSCLLVEGDKRIVGIVTEKDIVRRVAAKGSSLRRTKVKTIMSSPIKVIDAEATVEDALRVMADNKVRRLPVINNVGVQGLISIVDIAKALADKAGYAHSLIHAMVQQSEPRQGVYG